MSQAATIEQGAVVRAAMNYLVRTLEKPVSETGGPDGLLRRRAGLVDAREVAIEDGRPHASGLGLDDAGLVFVDHPTAMRDFADPDELSRLYYAEAAELIARVSGARRVHVFDHTLRTSDEADRLARKIREPVRAVHNDYTEWSGPNRLREILADEADGLLERRFAIIQVWRATGRPIERDPLAIIDSRSLAPEDFIAAERRFPHRVGEIYQFQYNPAHRWLWFPRMRRDEALVFKVYDSAKDGRARWGAHSAFEHPATPPGAPPRESIELRAFAFF